jgi:Flp pilus assembly pilin Flp
MKSLCKGWNRFWREEDGLGTLEVILILAVVVLLALLFKDWIMDLLETLLDRVDRKAKTIID